MKNQVAGLLMLAVLAAIAGAGRSDAQGGFGPKNAPGLQSRLPALRTQGGREDSDLKDTERAKNAYLDVAHVSALSPEEQDKQISYIYRDVETQLSPLYIRMLVYCGGVFANDRQEAAHETPEAFAERLAAKKNWIGLYSAAETARMELLAKHPKSVNKLVLGDLRSGELNARQRGLEILAHNPQRELFEPVMEAYLDPANASIVYVAANALQRMRDSRTLDRLLPLMDSAKAPSNYVSVMQSLLTGKPAPAPLLRALENGDSKQRIRVLTMLLQSRDDHLAPVLTRLFKDDNTEVRRLAAAVAVQIPGPAFQQVRPGVLALLHDSDRDNRLYVAMMLANKQDTAAGPALLDALKDAQMEQGAHSNVVQAMNTLAGSYFDYDLGNWKPTTETNRAAIARFADWVAAHPAQGL